MFETSRIIAVYCIAQLSQTSAVAENSGRSPIFFQCFYGVLTGILLLSACRRIPLPSYCCSAVSRSLIARPPPFLGVSSLNLAALTSGHFFCPDLLAAGFVARSLAYQRTRRFALLPSDQNLWGKTVCKKNYSAASGKESGVPSCDSGSAVRWAMARVRRPLTDSKLAFLAMRSSSRYSARLISICRA